MGRTTWRWHEPCRTQQFALLFAERMLRNLGASIHCFEQFLRATFLRSSLIATLRVRRIQRHRDSRCGAAQRDMASSRNGGTFRKRSYALAHAHSPKFELDFEKNKIGLRKK